MEEITTPQIGNWKLVLVSQSSLGPVSSLLARLALQARLLVLDGGNRFQAFRIAREVRGDRRTLERIRVSRAFTCFQMAALLSSVDEAGEFIVITDFLSTFYDEAIPFAERSRLLESCLPHFQRLAVSNGLLVTVCPPGLPSAQADLFIRRLAERSNETYAPMPAKALPAPMRLF